MTASEFTFLALGLVLGVVSGAALVEVLRARPPAPREVRVTVATDAIPRRRGSTLSDDAFATAVPEPARGGPADRRLVDQPAAAIEAERRTLVRSGFSTVTVAGDAAAAGPFPGASLEPRFHLADPPMNHRQTSPPDGIPVAPDTATGPATWPPGHADRPRR